MKKENVLASYLISLGEEVFHLLLAKGAKKEDTEDIIQNTFYKVYTLLDDLTESNIRPWFFRVSLNEYIDLKRKKDQQNINLTQEIYSKLQHTDHEFEKILENLNVKSSQVTVIFSTKMGERIEVFIVDKNLEKLLDE